MTCTALKYCIWRGSFSEMFDTLAIITIFKGVPGGRTDEIKGSELIEL